MKYPAVVLCPHCKETENGFEAILKGDEVFFVCRNCGEVAFKVGKYSLCDEEAEV